MNRILAIMTLSVTALVAGSSLSAHGQGYVDAALQGGTDPSITARANLGGGFTLITPTTTSGPIFLNTATSTTPRCGVQKNGDYVLCEPIPGVDPVQKDPAGLLRNLYVLAFVAAGTVAFVRVVYGGIIYGTSGVVEQKSAAKKIFLGVAQGMALLMGSYVILRTINPALVTSRFPDAANYLPPVVQRDPFNLDALKKINQEDQQRNFDISEEEIARIRAAGSQGQDLLDAQTALDSHQRELDYLQSLPDPTQTQQDRLAAIQSQTDGYWDDLFSAEAAMQDVVKNNPEAAAIQMRELGIDEFGTKSIAHQNQENEQFWHLTIEDAEQTIRELGTKTNLTAQQESDLAQARTMLPTYRTELAAAEDATKSETAKANKDRREADLAASKDPKKIREAQAAAEMRAAKNEYAKGESDRIAAARRRAETKKANDAQTEANKQAAELKFIRGR